MSDEKTNNNNNNNSTVHHLEVQTGENGQTNWKKVGPIHLLDSPHTHHPNSHDPPPTITPNPTTSKSKRERDNKQQHTTTTTTDNDKTDRRRYRMPLPLELKQILSPDARIKSDRRSKYLYRHSSHKVDTNLLILLHGAGDSHLPYHELAKTMNLPQTASLSLHASSMSSSSSSSSSSGFVELPLGMGHTWFQEMDHTTGLPLPNTSSHLRTSSLERAVKNLNSIIASLVEEGGWIPERIFLFGFSAGASLAMETCVERFGGGRMALGGVVCIAGGWRETGGTGVRDDDDDGGDGGGGGSSGHGGRGATPVLIVTGSDDEIFPPSAARKAKDRYNELVGDSNSANVYVKDGKKHVMIDSPREMKVVMEFFAKYMVRRMVNMEEWSDGVPSATSTTAS